MANVFLTSAAPSPGDSCSALRDAAGADVFGAHRLTDDAARADVVLFVESWRSDPFLTAARAHPLVRRYREKCFAFCEFDDAVPFLPGLYTSNGAGRPYALRSRVRTGFYLTMYHNPYVEPEPTFRDAEHLYSFVGSVSTARVRRGLAALDHHGSLFVDTSARSAKTWAGDDGAAKEAFRREYADALRRSCFVLCPRGLAPSTVRLFDAMCTGRAPVVLSDAWIPPEGPDWSSFIVRIPERHAARVPDVLRERAAEAEAMGRLAHAAWEAWYAEPVRVHHAVEACLSIARARRLPEALLRFGVAPQLLRPRVLKNFFRPFLKR